jgi:hypothetical protein
MIAVIETDVEENEFLYRIHRINVLLKINE